MTASVSLVFANGSEEVIEDAYILGLRDGFILLAQAHGDDADCVIGSIAVVDLDAVHATRSHHEPSDVPVHDAS